MILGAFLMDTSTSAAFMVLFTPLLFWILLLKLLSSSELPIRLPGSLLEADQISELPSLVTSLLMEKSSNKLFLISELSDFNSALDGVEVMSGKKSALTSSIPQWCNACVFI